MGRPIVMKTNVRLLKGVTLKFETHKHENMMWTGVTLVKSGVIIGKADRVILSEKALQMVKDKRQKHDL